MAAFYWLMNLLFPSTSHFELMNSTLPIQLAWEFQAMNAIRIPPIVGEDGTVYINADDYIFALDPENGQIKWRHQITQDAYGFILPYTDLVFVTTSMDSILQALRARDGRLVWEVALAEFAQAHDLSPPSTKTLFADGGYIYVGLTLRRGTDVLVFEPATGRLVWKAQEKLSNQAGVPFTIFAGQEGIIVDSGDLIILDKTTGQILRWEEDPPIRSSRPPSYNAGVLYTNGEIVRAVDLNTLQEKWRFEHGCSGSWDPLFRSPPIIADEVAYLLTNCQFVYAVTPDTGQLLWRYEDSRQQSPDAFTIFQDVGYLLTTDATLHALDLRTGQELGYLEAKPQRTAPIESNLIAGSRLLLVRYGSNQLFAFKGSSP
jgi:outer membrane protein assembly factor BamB